MKQLISISKKLAGWETTYPALKVGLEEKARQVRKTWTWSSVGIGKLMYHLHLTPSLSSGGKTADGVEEKPNKHVRVNAEKEGSGKASTTTTGPAGEKRVVTMEPSVRSFAGPSSARRDRSDPVMITDALADVRVK